MVLQIISGSESADEIERMLYAPDRSGRIGLTRQAVISMIDRFLSGLISGGELERIAEMIDANERIIIDDGDHVDLTTAIFQISSSEINGPLTKARVASVREALKGQAKGGGGNLTSSR